VLLTASVASSLAPLTAAATNGDRPSLAHGQGSKILMAHYMPWYETPSVRGFWGRHWTGHQSQHKPENTGTNGLPDIWSHYHPLIGPYDSADADALECHLLQMKLAGIHGVIADWYGISDAADYPPIHAATRALFDATGRFGMKFVACYEDRTVELLVNRKKLRPAQVTDHLTQTLQWMHTEWFTRPQYLRVRSRPLLLNFGPIYVRDPAVWHDALKALPERPALYALHHLWKATGADGGFTWVHPDPWKGTPNPKTIRNRIREVFARPSSNPDQVIVSACPGFKDVYKDHFPSVDHRGGRTMQEMLDVAMQGPWQLIQLVTWNDYGEGTMIEPTHEFGYTFLEIVQRARRKESGGAFAAMARDLRLPARLYALRKAGDCSKAALDRIANLLNQGACGPARKELDALERADSR